MYYLGIDGGGTKTALTLIDHQKKIIHQKKVQTTHYHQIGFEGLSECLQQAIVCFLQEALINKSDIKYTFIGLPGYGEVKPDSCKIKQIVAQCLKGMNYHLGNDVEAGWAGSLACESGINIVAGTGAIAFGKDKNGRTARSSGWGHICGDEGSAYWIAICGIENYTKGKDNRKKKGLIIDIFDKELALKDQFDIIKLIHDDYALDRSKIAALSKLVFYAAQKGDEQALLIFKRAAYEYYLMVKSIVNQLSFDDKINISYTGGVFKAKQFILPYLESYLKENNINAQLVEPKFGPEFGAALYAYKLAT